MISDAQVSVAYALVLDACCHPGGPGWDAIKAVLIAADRAAWSDDINTAPKDGAPILVHGDEIDTRIVAFEPGHDAFPWAETIGGSCFPSELIQWWRPLPSAPR